MAKSLRILIASVAVAVAVAQPALAAGASYAANVSPSDAGSNDTNCPAELSPSPGDVCVFTIVASTDGSIDVNDLATTDSIAIDAVRRTAATGDEALAKAFIKQARHDLSATTISRMESAITHPRPGKQTLTLEPSAQAAPSGDVTPNTSVIGNPKYETTYLHYVVVQSNGTSYEVSTTYAEWYQYLNTDSVTKGMKSLAVHYTKTYGDNTYYSAGVCKIRHVDPFFDQDVATWGKCATPDTNVVNYWDVYRYDKDYYGTRGERYYNKFWINVNPAGSVYPTITAVHSGPRWKNPDAGGWPFWL